ncbi:MAG: hypothetical protein Q8P07_01435 [bacterium]|nr:hypothetical protein [bacterium]
MPQIISQTKRINDLTPSERATMFGLLSLEFLGTRREDFIHDLDEKDVVALLRKESCGGEIVGFSTLMLLDLPVQCRKVKAVFSGDTTVLPEFRSSAGIGIEVGSYFMRALRTFSGHEIYYVLISKGWRTYKVLPFFFKDYAPKHGVSTSTYNKAVMNAFGKVKYPGDYDADNGLIMFSKETQRLIPGSIDAVPPRNPDLHTTFFLKKNPTYLSGTELVCVAPVSEENFAHGMIRLLKNAKGKM